jgi:hypothetical protein
MPADTSMPFYEEFVNCLDGGGTRDPCVELLEIGTARDALARLAVYLDLPRRENHQDHLSAFFDSSLYYISAREIACVFRFDSNETVHERAEVY